MMTQKAELVIEGSYLYFQDDVNYSQENFKLYHVSELGQYHMDAEILSRIETGEFLKVLVHYEMTNHFIPYFVRVEKAIGNRYVQENFLVDLNAQELHYVFQSPKSKQEFKKSHSSKHYITSPSFATSALWTLSKKFDHTGRTPVTIVSSPNVWSYDMPPQEKMVYAEFKNRELDDYKLNNSPLEASHLCLYENDASATVAETPVDMFLSKHFAIPYQMVQGKMRIDIKTLKKHDA